MPRHTAGERIGMAIMHIPDGYLSPQTYLPMYGLSLAFWTVALKKIRKELSSRHVPYLAMAAAFSFLIQLFNIPAPGGTTGHAVGAGIIAVLLGPWTAVVAVSLALIVQAIVFGDGGITAVGANCFNMAVVMPFVSYWTFKFVRGGASQGTRVTVAAFLSGYAGLSSAAIITALELGIQPLIASGSDGRPLYAPYPLSITLPAMALEHLLLFSIVEGLMTVLLFKYFMKNDAGLVYAFRNY